MTKLVTIGLIDHSAATNRRAYFNVKDEVMPTRRRLRSILQRIPEPLLMAVAIAHLIYISALASEAKAQDLRNNGVTDSQQSEASIIAAYRQMQRMMLDADVDGLDGLLTRDFVLVHMTGYPQSREEWLNDVKTGRMKYFTSREERIFHAEVSASQAKLVGRNEVRADIWGMQGTWPLQLDVEFRIESGRWKIASAKASTYGRR